MSKPGFMASGQGIAIGAAAVVALFAGGLYLGGVFTKAPAPKDVVVADQAAPAALPETPTEIPTVALDPAPETVAMPEPPRIDVFRLELDGTMLIAGSTAPGWATDIMLDGQALSAVGADGAGQFVEFVTLQPSDMPRILSLRTSAPDSGITVSSVEEVIIAPTPKAVVAPVELALAETASDDMAETASGDMAETASEVDPGTASPEPLETASAPEVNAPKATAPEVTAPEVTATSQTQPAPSTGEMAPALPASPQAADADPAQPAPEAPTAPDVAAVTVPTVQTLPADPKAKVETPEEAQGDSAVAVAQQAETPQAPPAEIQTAQTDPSQPEMTQTEPAQPETAPARPAQPETAQTKPAQPAIVKIEPAEIQTAQTDPAQPEITQTEPAQTQTVQAAPPQPAPAQMSQTVLLTDDSGVKVLQRPAALDAAPQVMSSVALDAITYSDAGEVELTGRAVGEGFVRVYLDNAPIVTSRITPDGSWRTDLPQVDTGVYTLRIDEVDSAGVVTSRLETPFKREDEQVLAAVELESAAPRVRAVTVQPGSTLWAISREAYGEGILYVRVFEANSDRIRNPDLIYPGQVFTLPE